MLNRDRGGVFSRTAMGACLALAAAALSAGVEAAPASAAVKIYRTDEQATLLGKFESGNCRVRGRGEDKHFRVSAKSTPGRDFELELTILKWRGYGEQYDFKYGTNKPGVFYLSGRGRTYSNIWAPPGQQGAQAGGVALNRRGSKMSVGFLPTPTENFRHGVVLAGQMRC